MFLNPMKKYLLLICIGIYSSIITNASAAIISGSVVLISDSPESLPEYDGGVYTGSWFGYFGPDYSGGCDLGILGPGFYANGPGGQPLSPPFVAFTWTWVGSASQPNGPISSYVTSGAVATGITSINQITDASTIATGGTPSVGDFIIVQGDGYYGVFQMTSGSIAPDGTGGAQFNWWFQTDGTGNFSSAVSAPEPGTIGLYSSLCALAVVCIGSTRKLINKKVPEMTNLIFSI